MRIRPRSIAVLAVLLVLLAGISAGPAAARQVLPNHLKAVHCSRLADLHGAAHDKHYLRDLCGKDHALYVRMYNTISGESCWHSWVVNSSNHAGYAQFAVDWANGNNAGHWVWNRLNGTLNVRMFYYCVTHPGTTGGWSTWAGH